jgi:hypothetical protein
VENLQLIDWKMVGFASLWILGLAILLSVLGFADDEAKRKGSNLRMILRNSRYQVAINAGLTIFCAGVAGSVDVLWETALWSALALAFGVFFFKSWRTLRRSANHE